MERPPTAGWTDTSVARAPAAGSRLTQVPTYVAASPPGPEARHSCGLGRTAPAGLGSDPRPGQRPGVTTPALRPTAHPAERKRTRVNQAGRRVKPATHWPQWRHTYGPHLPPNGARCWLQAPLTRTEPVTTDWRIPGPARLGQRSDFRQNVPGKLALGTGATSECPNSRSGRATGPGRPKTPQDHPHVPTRLQQRNSLRAD